MRIKTPVGAIDLVNNRVKVTLTKADRVMLINELQNDLSPVVELDVPYSAVAAPVESTEETTEVE